MVPVECSYKDLEPQAQLTSHTCFDLNSTQGFAKGMMKIVPSDADIDADYWLLSNAKVSITNMWKTDSVVDWNAVDMLPSDFGIISRPQTPSSEFATICSCGQSTQILSSSSFHRCGGVLGAVWRTGSIYVNTIRSAVRVSRLRKRYRFLSRATLELPSIQRMTSSPERSDSEESPLIGRASSFQLFVSCSVVFRD